MILFFYVCSSLEPPEIIYEIVHPDYEEFKNSEEFKKIGSDSVLSFPKFEYYKLSLSVKYPIYAKYNNIQGRVYIKALIDTLGRAIRVLVDSSDNDYLNYGALEPVSKMEYEPAINFNGKKVAVYISFPLNFKLNDRNEKPTH